MFSALPVKTLDPFIKWARMRQHFSCMRHSLGNSLGQRHIFTNRESYMDTST
ncbi:hypothetical protein J2Y74_004269 [Pseudomonas migulae]|nr:hypothetical protein [Pseudomonas migulae]